MFLLSEVPLLLVLASTPKPTVIHDHDTPALQSVTACGAISRAEIQRVVGRTLDPGRESRVVDQSTCDYSSKTGKVMITIQRLREKLDIPAEVESLKTAIPEATVRPVRGIGTCAFFLDIADAGTQLHIIREDRDYVLVSILGFGDAGHVSAAAERIARTILERL
jgi:hypothetical protein